ncbi:MAG: NAD(P)H-hydrate dehydratase [Planctomycetota bacterium]
MAEPEPIELLPALPSRPADGHKGTFGTVLVLGGSPLMFGAPALCATAALRSGAGLVKVVGDPAWLTGVITIQPSVTGVDRASLGDLEMKAGTVWAVGPGLGTEASAREAVRVALRSDRPVVLDADGLNTVAAGGSRQHRETLATRRGGTVLTPHPGEFRRLAAAYGIDQDPTDPEQRPDAAAALAHATQTVVLLKGRHTVVTDGKRLYRNTTGSPSLATAGSGDVLTGLIAGLIAQGAEPFDAAVAGAYVHGLAGERWAQRHGPSGLLALDLADALPEQLRGYSAGEGSGEVRKSGG